MTARKDVLRLVLLSATAVLLGGCLISETALLDARNGRAAPLESGEYLACEHDGEGGAPDCRRMAIARDRSGLYALRAEDEEQAVYARFRRIGRRAYLAQLIGEDDEDYFFFLGERKGGAFTLMMINCEDIPGDVRARYVARGEMTVDDSVTTCVATTLRAATASAKAYRAAAPLSSRPRVVYRRISDPLDQEEK